MSYPRAIVYATPWIAAAVVAVMVGPATGAIVALFAMIQNVEISEDKP